MPLIPLKQAIIVTKPGVSDGWGGVIPGEVLALKARVSEETNVVTNQLGKEAVTGLRITLDKLADVSYDDVITYTNELDVTVNGKPVHIAVKRGISGRPLLTEVFV